MSVWTHVAAIFRVDSLRFANEDFDFGKVFGKECLWRSDSKTWDDQRANPDSYLPTGSEGSLRISVWDNPDKHHLAAYTVSVFGDLRDYDDVDALGKWFRKTCRKTWIRQAVCHVMCENGVTRVWQSRSRAFT